jgi:N-acetylglucosamine-6-phosphate deacetylase
VKKAKITSETKAITGDHETLSGGCLTITETSRRLIEMGFDKHAIENCISKNPERYLSRK